jgi:hypothetical protein
LSALPDSSAFCILRSAFALSWLWWSLGVALVEPWGGFGVALGWLWGAYQLAINRLWGGFDVALADLALFIIHHSTFCIPWLRVASGWP